MTATISRTEDPRPSGDRAHRPTRAELSDPAFWRARWAPLGFWASTAAVALAFFAGAWERRWIADDGLIVLRTVRNMLAGNGPVFNAGERVEANTSTLWTYLIWICQKVFQAPQLELVALWLALVCSVAAVVFAMWGTRIMWAGTLRHPGSRHRLLTTGTLMLPLGTLVYIVLPPARDFATSGLETGLVICWIAVVWMLTQRWARAPHSQGPLGLPRPGTALLAFVAGLGPLVRPESLLVAVAVLALIFFARSSMAHRAWLVVIAGVVPVAYQLWRMSYYALPYPNTAVAKDAGGAKWAQGMRYLEDLAAPYWLALPIVVALLVVVAAAWAGVREAASRRSSSSEDGATDGGAHDAAADGVADAAGQRRGPFGGRLPQLRSMPVVTALFVACGIVLALYSIRVGGDFMHGRVLLPALFTLLLPLAVVPIPALRRGGDRKRRLLALGLGIGWLVVAVWAVVVSIAQDPFPERPEGISPSGIVDERVFYMHRTGHKHPVLARDYLDFPRMGALVASVRDNQTGAVFLPLGGVQDLWEVVDLDHSLPGMAPFEKPDDPTHMVVFLNLGMTSANLPLEVKVYDTVGLATPLAAHTDRMIDGRIGHDKYLPPEWFIADSALVENPNNYPDWVDPDTVEQAKVALTCPATIALRESYSGPLTMERRKENLLNAFSYAQYRINRVPAYEVQRCGLPMPDEVDLEAFPR